MALDLAEFRKYLVIDKHTLDDEIVRQPTLFEKVSDACVEAIAERDALKEELASVDAKLDGEIRAKLSAEKATEGQIKSRIQVNNRHVVAMEHYLHAKQVADQFNVLKEAFEQRNFMLRKLVDLYTSNYFESSSVRSTAQEDRLVYERRRAKLGERKHG